MATVKIYRRLVPKNPFDDFEVGQFELPDNEEVLNIMDLNSYNFVVLTWEPPGCTCPGCDGALLDYEGEL